MCDSNFYYVNGWNAVDTMFYFVPVKLIIVYLIFNNFCFVYQYFCGLYFND